MAAKRCPKCKLINPGTTVVCDCGWSFVDGTMSAPRDPQQRDDALREEHHARGARQLGIGVLLLLVGILITATTYSSASTSGGSYLIAYGPIIFGIVHIVRGLVSMNR
jgi:hypothetical protein